MVDRLDIATEIEALAAHCRPPLMTVEQRAMWLRDWCDDLRDFDIEAIKAGCRAYRQSGQGKFPTPGQLLPLIRGGQMPANTGQRVEVWRVLDEAEYQALDLRAKIRHQTILAHEARTKVGPMFRNSLGEGIRSGGVHLTPDDMPPASKRWADIARGHEAEAGRLRQYLRGKPMAAE